MPALILLYAQIDGIAWLANVVGLKTDKARPNYKAWLERYVLIHGEEVSAMDLWAARCAVLHTQTPDSDLSAKGEARRIRYRLQNKRSLIQSPGTGKSHTLNPLGLAEKVQNGIAAWLSDVERDGAKHADFCDRAARIFDPSALVNVQDGTSDVRMGR